MDQTTKEICTEHCRQIVLEANGTSLTKKDLYTAIFVSARSIQLGIQEHFHTTPSISQVFVKRSGTT